MIREGKSSRDMLFQTRCCRCNHCVKFATENRLEYSCSGKMEEGTISANIFDEDVRVINL